MPIVIDHIALKDILGPPLFEMEVRGSLMNQIGFQWLSLMCRSPSLPPRLKRQPVQRSHSSVAAAVDWVRESWKHHAWYSIMWNTVWFGFKLLFLSCLVFFISLFLSSSFSSRFLSILHWGHIDPLFHIPWVHFLLWFSDDFCVCVWRCLSGSPCPAWLWVWPGPLLVGRLCLWRPVGLRERVSSLWQDSWGMSWKNLPIWRSAGSERTPRPTSSPTVRSLQQNIPSEIMANLILMCLHTYSNRRSRSSRRDWHPPPLPCWSCHKGWPFCRCNHSYLPRLAV